MGLVARFFTNILGIVAACVLTVGNFQRVVKRTRIGLDLEEFIAGWRSLTVCQPCVILMEVTLAVLRWDTQGLIKLLSGFCIPFICTIYFLFLVESFYRDEVKGCAYERLESASALHCNDKEEEKKKMKPVKSVHSYESI